MECVREAGPGLPLMQTMVRAAANLILLWYGAFGMQLSHGVYSPRGTDTCMKPGLILRYRFPFALLDLRFSHHEAGSGCLLIRRRWPGGNVGDYPRRRLPLGVIGHLFQSTMCLLVSLCVSAMWFGVPCLRRRTNQLGVG